MALLHSSAISLDSEEVAMLCDSEDIVMEDTKDDPSPDATHEFVSVPNGPTTNGVSESAESKDNLVNNASTSSAGPGVVERRITRELLEVMIHKKLVDCLGDNDLEVSQLRNKIYGIQNIKDKVCQKLTTLQKQVQEVTKSVVQVSETLASSSASNTPPPLRFFRSVGLQVNSDTRTQLSVQNSNSIRTKENALPYKNGIIGPAPASVKRNLMNKTAAGINQVISPNKRLSPQSSVTNTVNQINTADSNVMIDLTEDNKIEANAPVIINQGGIQFRVVNQTNTGLGPGMHLINTPNGYQIVNTSQGQTRPIIIQPIQTAASPGGVVFRAVGPNQVRRASLPRVGTAIRSIAPNPGNINRFQQAPSPMRPQLQSVANKFTLPQLPPPASSNNIPRKCGKDLPPRPDLNLKTQPDGIVLSWSHKLAVNNAEILTYQIFACQESLDAPRGPAQWKRVGDVKALPLPMACTLSQFTDENRYHFIVRGVDVYNRTGLFCEPVSILKKKH